MHTDFYLCKQVLKITHSIVSPLKLMTKHGHVITIEFGDQNEHFAFVESTELID